MPEPITYTGSGDDVIEIETFSEFQWYLHIEGNETAEYFGVKGYDENDNKVATLVNTTSSYSGDVIDSSFTIKTLEIISKADWSITIAPTLSLPSYGEGESIQGKGDAIVVLQPSLSTVSAVHHGKENFIVTEYTGNPITETNMQLFLNEIGKYEGKLKLSKDAFILEIISKEDWELTFN